MTLSQSKSDLRQHHLRLRRRLTTSERFIKDSLVAHKLGRFLTHLHTEKHCPLRLGAYTPFGDEVSPFLELAHILEEKHLTYEVSVPLFKPKYKKKSQVFEFYTAQSLEHYKHFLRKSRGVDTWMCPTPTLWEKADTQLIPYWIVPGICFSKDCKRIGFGTGYYDRWLSQHSGIFIGIAYEVQMTDAITPEPFDIPMDIVFTDKHTYIRPEALLENPTLLEDFA